ncbi:hypothetical protein Droror1_Dr00002913 [Drosera rotundifolia]
MLSSLTPSSRLRRGEEPSPSSLMLSSGLRRGKEPAELSKSLSHVSLSASSSTAVLFKFQMSPVVELCKKFSLPLPSSPKAPPKPTASATSPRLGSRRGHSLPPAFLSSSLTRAGLTPFVIVGIDLNEEIGNCEFNGARDPPLDEGFGGSAKVKDARQRDLKARDLLIPWTATPPQPTAKPVDCKDDQYYTSYPAGTELLTDTTKLYKFALGNVFEVDEWGPIEYCIMAKHFERQGKSPYAYYAVRRLSVERMMGWNVRWRECVLAMIRSSSLYRQGCEMCDRGGSRANGNIRLRGKSYLGVGEGNEEFEKCGVQDLDHGFVDVFGAYGDKLL